MPIRAWSHTAADNDDADSPSGIGLAENMAPGGMNDSARAQMAEIAKWEDDTNGSLVGGGTGDVITLTTSQSITSLMDGDVFTFRTPGANTGSVTLNVNAIGAKALKHSGGSDLVAGDLISGAIYRATYIQGSDEFRIHAAPTFSGLSTGWTTYTPVVGSTSITTTSTVNSARYKKVGRICVVTFDVTIDSGTGGTLVVSLPFAPAVSGSYVGSAIDYATGASGAVYTTGSMSGNCNVFSSSGGSLVSPAKRTIATITYETNS